MGRLQGKIAVVTGGSSGIGECVARAFVREGAQVAICARSADKIEATADAISRDAGSCIAIPCDVTDESSIAELRARVIEALGAPDIVVNNAGVYKIANFLDTSTDDYRRAIEVNYLGVVNMIRAFLPAMLDAGYGKFVNVASTAGKYGSKFQAHYNGSKHAVLGVTRSLALEFAHTGVNINAICPGFVETPMLEPAYEEAAAATGLSAAEVREGWLSRIPMGRMLQPEEIGPLAIYLASSESDGMTGQAMTISGGMVLV